MLFERVTILKLKLKMLTPTIMIDALDLISLSCIHSIFGRSGTSQYFQMYYVKEKVLVDGREKCKSTGVMSKTLEGAFETFKNSGADRVWYYIPVKNYIIYVRGNNYLCLDYGHFTDTNPPMFECLNCKLDPLNSLKDLEIIGLTKTSEVYTNR